MPQQYLSTDPNAGTPAPASDEYLSQDPGAGAAPLVQNPNIARSMVPRASIADRAVASLPAAGAMAASSLAGGRSNPVGIGLAAVGGAAGEAWRQTISALRGDWDQVPATMVERAQQIVTEGLKQGGIEGAGRYVLAPLLRLFGQTVYRGALKPSNSVREEFPGVTAVAVREGLPITRAAVGTDKAARLVSESGAATRRTLEAAEAAGAKPVTMRPVAQSLARTRASVADQAIREADLKRVQTIRDRLLTENPRGVPLSRAQTMKQAEQKRAIAAYKKQARGQPVNELRLSAREDIARGLREAIERRVPDVGPMNKRTQELIGALKAVAAAENRIANNNILGGTEAVSGIITIGAGLRGDLKTAAALGLLTEVLTRPELASRLGIVFDRAGRPRVTPQALRTIGEAVNQVALEVQ